MILDCGLLINRGRMSDNTVWIDPNKLFGRDIIIVEGIPDFKVEPLVHREGSVLMCNTNIIKHLRKAGEKI